MNPPILCLGEINCQRCRAITANGDAFRAKFAKYLNTDGSCPFDKPMGWSAMPAPASSPGEPAKSRGGVGTELAKLIKQHGISDADCAICNQLRELFDGWGIEQCERRADEIEARLLDRAKERGFWFGLGVTANELTRGVIAGKPTARHLIAQAIANARDQATAAPPGAVRP